MPTSRFLTANELRLHYLDWDGDAAKPLVLLHGGAASCHWWDWVAPLLRDDYRVLALDWRGHGESERDAPPYHTRDFVADLEGLIQNLGLERPAVVGHSMGGHVALAHAALHPESVAALAVLDSLADLPEEAIEMLEARAKRPARRFAALEEAIDSFRLTPPQEVPVNVFRELAAHMYRQDADGSWVAKADRNSFYRELIDVPALLPKIPCPTLILRAGASAMSKASAELMKQQLPRSKLVELPGAEHHFVLDRPQETRDCIHSFLETCEYSAP